MLQNRVDPLGNIIKTAARGSWMGNRGVLHDEHQQILRPFKLKAWITCALEFKGKKRLIMAPNRWTELFFLDEATAFSAGHRPCAECRRKDFNRFKSFWLKANPEYNFTMKTYIREIDEILHKERIDRHRNKVTYEEDLKDLPPGVFVIHNDTPHIIADNRIFSWSPFGYGMGIAIPDVKKLTILTPRSIVNTFREGYTPQVALP